MLLINQDRNEIIPKTSPLYTFPAIHNGKIIGINLFHEESLLGTFDSVQEALAEKTRVETSKDEIYFINGYCVGEDAEIVQELLTILKNSQEGIDE